ncbi:McrC family protein, partial [Poseidonibacter sp.]|uniref:McrC family protein n=1 Tax=Poseidonibacter sp. TaxID=2321188 RepID=UPI003C74E7A9
MNEILTIVEHQVVYLSEKRDINLSTLSYEDSELLSNIIYIDKKDKKRFLFSYLTRNRIKANSIVGSVSLKNGLTIEILPKFANGKLTETLKKRYRETLLNIIRVSKEKNFIVTQSQSNKVSISEMPLINYIIELFSSSLLVTLRQGLYQTYTKEINNTSFIRGNILISKTIQNNFVDKSKMYCSYIKHSSNNLLMSVFKTLANLLMQDDNLSYKTKQNLHEIYILLDNVDLIDLREQDFEKIVFNRLNDKYEILFSQAKFIFNKYMPFSSKINAVPFWSILFSMDYLFEKFIAYLLDKSDLIFQEQSLTRCFKNEEENMFVSAKPDFIVESENSVVSVVDAKWKLLKKDEVLYGLNAQNFWQLFSYMSLIPDNEQINGYFIVPKNNDSFNDEISFEPINENNKSITIISIDFSLEFNEIVNNFYFEIENKQLKYRKKVTILETDINDEVVEKHISKFNMK